MNLEESDSFKDEIEKNIRQRRSVMLSIVVCAMVAALFVSPKAAYAEDAETVEYDLQAIIDATPSEAVISFPVVHESVYGNEIDWDVQADQDVLSYDRDAHWVVVNRPTEGEDQIVDLYLKLNGILEKYVKYGFKENVINTLIIVIRYFGGIKLGAGGLVRAYSKSVRDAILGCNKVEVVKGVKVRITISYDMQKNLDYTLRDYNIVNKIYDEKVTYTVLLPNDKLDLISDYDYFVLSEEFIIKI